MQNCVVQYSPQDDEDVLGSGDGSPFFLARHARRVLQLPPSAYRAAFLAILRGGDALAASAAVRVLLAVLMCRHADSALLDAAGGTCNGPALHKRAYWNTVKLPRPSEPWQLPQATWSAAKSCFHRMHALQSASCRPTFC